jgi:DNA-binding transcriptional MerR regulator
METISKPEDIKTPDKISSRLTITELAERIGITPKTIIRWEKAGKIKKPKRDWKGWRFYEEEDIELIQRIISTVYEI